MRQLLLPLTLTLLVVFTPAAHGLDTSAGVGLEQALFQETVDFTLTNQDGGDFHGQNLANTSFAGAVGRRADFSEANLPRRSSPRAPSPKPTSGCRSLRCPDGSG